MSTRYYIKEGNPVYQLYDTVNSLTGLTPENFTQTIEDENFAIGPNKEFTVDPDGTVNISSSNTGSPSDNIVNAYVRNGFIYMSCTKEDTVFKLVGAPIAKFAGHIFFKAPEKYDEGDTFMFNEREIPASNLIYMNGETLSTDDFVKDSYVTAFFDNESGKLFFKGGGLRAADREVLIPENVKYGVTLFRGTKNEFTGDFTGDGTIDASKMLAGEVAYSKGERIVGIIPSMAGGEQFAYANQDQTLSTNGKYMTSDMVLRGISQSGLSADNIRKGAVVRINNGNSDIFNVIGTYVDPAIGYSAGGVIRIHGQNANTMATPSNELVTGAAVSFGYQFTFKKAANITVIAASSGDHWADGVTGGIYINGTFYGEHHDGSQSVDWAGSVNATVGVGGTVELHWPPLPGTCAMVIYLR